MWNAIKEFFRKKDRAIVATFISGNKSIIKDGVPYVRLYTCWEDDSCNRSVKAIGRGPRDWRIEEIIECWLNYRLPYDHIPSYHDVTYGVIAPYGHEYYHEVFDGYTERMR